jgi:hypothetical protein
LGQGGVAGGKNNLTLDEIVRLQDVRIEDQRFVQLACGQMASFSARATTTKIRCPNS